MVLSSATKRKAPLKETKETKLKFAFIPTIMTANEDELCGEVIWLEKYVITKEFYQPYPNFSPDIWRWSEGTFKRLGKAILDKLESDTCT